MDPLNVPAGDLSEPVAAATIGGYADKDMFGYALSMNDEYLVASCYSACFAAYVFKRSDNGGGWSTTADAILTSVGSGSGFGRSVALSPLSKWIIVGADNSDASTSPKVACIFQRGSDGNWNTEPITVLSSSEDNTGYGFAVAITETFAVVTAKESGKVYFYKKDGNDGGESWNPVPQFVGDVVLACTVSLTDYWAIVRRMIKFEKVFKQKIRKLLL